MIYFFEQKFPCSVDLSEEPHGVRWPAIGLWILVSLFEEAQDVGHQGCDASEASGTNHVARGVVVADDMDDEFGRNLPVNLGQEIQPLPVGVPGGGVSEDLSGKIIQRGAERHGPVAVEIVGLRADLPLAQWQPGCVRSGAWHWLFSSQQSTTARSGGLR